MSRARYSPEQQAFYHNYLNSPQWRARRKDRIQKAGGRCEWVTDNLDGTERRCQRTRYLQVHHNSYEHLGAEYDGELDVFCWFHHTLEHLLWKKCGMCSGPALVCDAGGEDWLCTVLASMLIDLDDGFVNWERLPRKEILLDLVPSHCPACEHYLEKDD
jgi:hypothetical protein